MPAAHRNVAAIAGLAALGLALMLPVLLAPTPLSDSHGINLVWAHQFTALVAAGDFWPRWLPWSHDGLGAPVFYFYGPFAFWLAAVFGMAGLAPWPAIAAAATSLLIVSGIGMRAMLRVWRVRRPLVGAVFYMAAPYHLLDFARRGALAEFAAMALLPLVALALLPAARGRPAPLALAYAALILAHLPLALLATVLLLPMLLIERRCGRDELVRIAASLAIGIGLAAAFLVPALALQSHTAMATMRAAPLLRPANWTPASYWRGAIPAHLLLLAIGVALALAAPALAWRQTSGWRWHVLAVIALALGCAGPIWLLPGLDRVQFPWRALALAEFGVAVLVGSSRLEGPMLLAALAPALLLSSLVLAPSLAAIGGPEPAALATLLRRHPDVPEYLPKAMARGTSTVSVEALALARATPAARERDGMVTLRRAAFPIWQADCPEGLRPTGISPEGLIRLPARCSLVRVATLAERVGNALSLASLALLGALALRRRSTAFLRRGPAGVPA